MGVYSGNRTSNFEGSFLEEYTHPYAALDLVVEAQINDKRMFDAIITMDIHEAVLSHEGGAINEAEIKSLQEGTLSDIWEKIKTFIKKFIEKVKSIVKAFTTKLGTIFSSNRDMVSKYSKQYWRNDTSKMKIKNWRQPTGNIIKVGLAVNVLIDEAKTWTDGVKNKRFKTDDVAEKLEDNIDDLVETAYGKALDGGKYTAAEFKKEAVDYLSDSPEILDGLVGNNKTTVENVLKDTKIISNIEKDQREIEKTLRAYLKVVEQAQKDAVKDSDTNPNKNKSIWARTANYSYTLATHAQTVCGTGFSVSIQLTKMWIAQCRRAYAMAVNYRKKKNESWDIDDFDGTDDQTLLDAIGESAAFEVESDFDQFAYEI